VNIREQYQTEIKGILNQTGFKDSYQMALTDIWMKITLKNQNEHVCGFTPSRLLVTPFASISIAN